MLRTTRVEATAETFATHLAEASGDRVVMLVDERRAPAAASSFETLGITDAACRVEGLYRPTDYTWRCGDYGFYLARARFPDEEYYWMIEYDVRISGDARGFFAAAAASPADLLAAQLRPADASWWWWATVRARDAAAYRCFFPVVRLSARAVDVLGQKRRAHSRRPLRRALWANDESFVATAAVKAGLHAADFNDLGQQFHDETTFSYYNIVDGAMLSSRDDEAWLYHPVLFGDDYQRKVQRLKQDARHVPKSERAYRKLVGKLNGMTPW